MSKNYEDWTDWAGDNSQQAEADLRAAQAKADETILAAIRKGLEESAAGDTVSLGDFTQYVNIPCLHEFHLGECLICEETEEGYEPSDAVIFAHYGQTKEPGVAA